MDCTICGKSTLPGAMLCAPCKAALKRARYVTVQEDMRRPSIIDVRRKPRRARAAEPTPPAPVLAAVASTSPDVASNAQLARRIFAGIAVLAVFLGGVSYFGLRELGARSQEGLPEVSAPVAVLEAAATTPSPPVTTEASGPTLVTAPADVAVSTSAPFLADAAPPLPSSIKLAGNGSGKRARLQNDASFATANGDPPDAVAMPEPEKPAPAPPPAPLPVPDRWQTMRDAIAQCDREGVFAGVICGQKVRIQYCDGYWGKVATCPGPTANPER